MAKTRRCKPNETTNLLKLKSRTKRGKHCQWSESAMMSAIQAVREQGMSQRTACRTFSVPRCTLQVRLSGVTELGARPGHPTNLSLDEEKKLVDFACNRAALGIGFGRQQFLSYAERFAAKHKKQFKRGRPSMKWWRGIRKRHRNLSLRQPEGTAAVRHQCMDPCKIAKYFIVLRKVVNDHDLQNKPHVIWNMDETGMQLDHRPGHIVARTGSKYLHSRTSGNKEMITVIAAVNAAGGSLSPHIIVKGKTKRSLFSFQPESAPDGCTWSVSDSGWTKQGIALLWFKECFLPNIGPHRPQLLIVDGHDSHNFLELIDVAVENQIHILELPAHTSNWLQPCDRTVFGPLKNAYRKACEDLTCSFPGTLVSRASFCGLLKKAWLEAVTESNIKSGFRACGIFPFCPEAIPAEAYMPNSLYTVATLMENEQLLNNTDGPPDQQTDGSDGTAKTSNSVLAEPVSAADGHLEPAVPMPSDADSQPVNGYQAMDHVTQFLSSEPAVLSVLCAAAPPPVGLSLLESTLSEQQLHCFRYCYSKGYSLDKDDAFASWMTLKTAAENQISDDVSFASLPDVGTSSDVEISVDDLMSSVSAEQPFCATDYTVSSRDEQPVVDPEKMTDADHQMIRQEQDQQTTTVAEQDLPMLNQRHGGETAEVATSVCVASTSSPNAHNFPFHNRSFPGDPDSDILQYPGPVVHKKKTVTKQKFFLLTSKEAHESKLKEAQEKLMREKEKEERANARKQKVEKRAQGKPDTKKTNRRKCTHLKQKQSKKDCTPCGICEVVHFKDTSGRNWIECSGCKVWYHNACQGLEESHTAAFFCIACESE